MVMGKIIDLTNKRFDRLLVMRFSHKDKYHKAYWICKCDCGKTKTIAGSSLRRHLTNSCGCFRIEKLKSDHRRLLLKKLNTKNGKWVGKDNPFYGKRGIKNPAYRKEVRDKISLSKMGNKNPAWVNGKSHEPYCDVFFDKEFRTIVLNRDKHVCQNCGVTRLLSLKVFDQNLAIHHINYDKKDCDLFNLITVCSSCNAKANINRSYWQSHYYNLMKSR
jgi:hypothetical protein